MKQEKESESRFAIGHERFRDAIQLKREICNLNWQRKQTICHRLANLIRLKNEKPEPPFSVWPYSSATREKSKDTINFDLF